MSKKKPQKPRLSAKTLARELRMHFLKRVDRNSFRGGEVTWLEGLLHGGGVDVVDVRAEISGMVDSDRVSIALEIWLDGKALRSATFSSTEEARATIIAAVADASPMRLDVHGWQPEPTIVDGSRLTRHRVLFAPGARKRKATEGAS